MRKAFLDTLVQIAEQDDRIVLLTADLGFSFIEKFQARFPERFINVGVSEQNLIAVGTGLAKAGFIPFVYSIIPFATLRPFEFIRNGPVLHNLPVRIIGIGSGFEYGQDGITHYGLEDIGVLRTQPNMRIIAPADFEQAQNAVMQTYSYPGPIYYRLGKNENAKIDGLNGQFGDGKPILVRKGHDLIFLSYGSVSQEVETAVKKLKAGGISVGQAIIDTIQPFDRDALLNLIQEYRMIVTVESHYITGGLGSLVAELIAEECLGSRLIRIGVDRLWDGKIGGESFMLDHYGLSAEKIYQRVLERLI